MKPPTTRQISIYDPDFTQSMVESCQPLGSPFLHRPWRNICSTLIDPMPDTATLLIPPNGIFSHGGHVWFAQRNCFLLNGWEGPNCCWGNPCKMWKKCILLRKLGQIYLNMLIDDEWWGSWMYSKIIITWVLKALWMPIHCYKKMPVWI